MKNYFIIHGFMGSNIENWFPWFKEKIDSDNTLNQEAINIIDERIAKHSEEIAKLHSQGVHSHMEETLSDTSL